MGGPKIRDLGLLMKVLPDTVSHKISDHRKSMCLRPCLDRMRDIEKAISYPCLFNPNVKSLLCHLKKASGCLIYIAYRQCDGGIPKVTIEIDTHIETHNIPFFPPPLARNAWDHFFINRNTERRRKPSVS